MLPNETTTLPPDANPITVQPQRNGGTLTRAISVLKNETGGLHIRLRLLNILFFFLPHFTWNRVRTGLYRLAGVRVGRHTLVLGRIEMSGAGRVWERLQIGAECQITTPLYADLNANITIGDNVAVAHHAVFVTTNHEIGPSRRRSGSWSCAPIVIEDGCWIGARATILPGVTIGAGSIVAAGAVVAKSTPANTLVGGVPAKVIRSLEPGEMEC